MKRKLNGMRMGLGGVRPEMANHLGYEERGQNGDGDRPWIVHGL